MDTIGCYTAARGMHVMWTREDLDFGDSISNLGNYTEDGFEEQGDRFGEKL